MKQLQPCGTEAQALFFVQLEIKKNKKKKTQHEKVTGAFEKKSARALRAAVSSRAGGDGGGRASSSPDPQVFVGKTCTLHENGLNGNQTQAGDYTQVLKCNLKVQCVQFGQIYDFYILKA